MPTREISNSQDVIDSRDVISRIADLESDREDLESAIAEAKEALADAAASPEQYPDWAEKKEELETAVTDAESALTDWDADYDGQELKALQSLAGEADGCSDWKYGEALIRDSYFTEYAQQLADDLGYIGRGKTDSWPFTCIDWEQAAEELQQDYTSVSFDGVDYWIRS